MVRQKLRTLIPLLFLLIADELHAQRFVPSFGTVTQQEMDVTSYAADPDAEAVVLFDVGDSYFFENAGGYDIRFTRMKRVKILSKAGIPQAEVSIPFYSERRDKSERIASIEAYSYNNVNGRPFKSKVDPSAVFEEQINNRWRVKKFVFPEVKEGTIIEYKYILETPFHYNLPDWNFQTGIPVVYSEYTVSMIPFYEYAFQAQGMEKFDYQSSTVSTKHRRFGTITFSDMVHTYAMKNIPAFRDESFIASVEDYIMKIDFQLSKFNRPTGGSEDIVTTWPALCDGLLKHERFGKYINAATKMGKKLLETDVQLAGLSDDKKAEAIIQYVKRSYQWNEFYGMYAGKSAKDFYEQKNGSIGDINLFLCGLLNAAGISAQPVILSTRGHGRIKSDYPFESAFNYVAVLVSGQRSFLTDGTDIFLSYDRMPSRCLNDDGLVVLPKDQGTKWVGLGTRIPSMESITIIMSIDPAKAIGKAEINLQRTEYYSRQYKTTYNDDSVKFKANFAEKNQLTLESVKTFNYDAPGRPYIVLMKGETPVEPIGNNLIVTPLLHFPMKENPLKQKTRAYAVDFVYPQANNVTALINIPTGYKVGALPQAVTMDNDIMSISFSCTLKGNAIEMIANYSFKKSRYLPSEYAKLRYYIDMVVQNFNAQLLLEKL